MKTTLPEATAGDVDQHRIVQLGETNADGEFVALVFTSLVDEVEAHVWRKKGSSVASATLTGAMTDEATGTIRIDLGAAGGWLPSLELDRGVTYEYLIEYQVSFLDGKVRTWGPDILPVRGQAD